MQLALSRDLARQVIKQLKLGELPEFDSALRGVSLMRYSLGFLGIAKDPLSMTPEERVLEAYYERLTVFPVDKSRVISIEFQSADPELAAKVANAVADTYLALQQTARQDQTRVASHWLSGEIDVLRKRVAEAEAKVEEFRSKTNLFIGTNNTSLSNQTLGESNRDLAAARSQKAELESKATVHPRHAQARRRARVRRHAQFRADPPPQRAARHLAGAARRAVLDAARQSSAHQGAEGADRRPRPPDPRRGAAAGAFAGKRRAHRRRAGRAAGERPRPAQAAGGLDQRAGRAAARADRDAKSQRDLLSSMLAKYREASARDSISAVPADARIISRAVVSNTPYFPKKMPIVLIATLATLFISAGFITTGELLAGNVYRPEEAAPAVAPVAAPVAAPMAAPVAAPVMAPAAEPVAPAAKRRWMPALSRKREA